MNSLSFGMKAYVGAMAVFLLAPILVIVAVAFTPGEFMAFPPTSLSFRWFAKVLSDKNFLLALWNSVRLAACATLVASALAVPATVMLIRHRPAGARAIQGFMLSPLSLPTIILAIGLLFLNAKIRLDNAFLALLAGHTVIVIPYIMRTVYGVYASTNQEIEQAAAVHGASPWAVFWHITLPLIRPGILAGAIFSLLMSFDEVSVALLLTNTDTTTLPVSILSYLLYNHDPSVAAMSTIQIAIAILSLLILERYFGVRKLMFSSR